MVVFTSKTDVVQWVNEMTNGWPERRAADVEQLVAHIMRHPERPHWNTDWSAFLTALPDLTELLADV